ncbi:MAG: hypothetical protein WEF53_12375 [Bacteroidota bacterium]
MKTNIVFSLIMSMVIVACTPQKTSPVQGAWKMVSATFVRNDSLIVDFPGKWTGSNIKMWSKEHVVFVGRFKSDTTLFDIYGGGRYELQGNRYEEIVQYHGVASAVGDTFKMLLEITNDTLAQTWPLPDNGVIDKSNYRQEKYVRLD